MAPNEVFPDSRANQKQTASLLGFVPRINQSCYAAKAMAGAGLGSHGPGIGRTNRAMSSEPQSPQRLPVDVETVSQFSQ